MPGIIAVCGALSFTQMQEQIPTRVAVVFAGGDPPPAEASRWVPAGAFVVAADSGLDHAHRLGFKADLLVGDLDSVSLNAADQHDGEVAKYSEDKNYTDLELAMEAATPIADVVIVVGGHGGRLDHLLANAELLADHRWLAARVLWVAGEDLAYVVRLHQSLYGRSGDLVSLIPLGGHAIGVTTEGLQWSLENATLAAGSTRGVSNRLLDTTAHISVRQGALLAVQPGAVITGAPTI